MKQVELKKTRKGYVVSIYSNWQDFENKDIWFPTKVWEDLVKKYSGEYFAVGVVNEKNLKEHLVDFVDVLDYYSELEKGKVLRRRTTK